MSRALILLSGGIDSAAALAWAHKNFEARIALSFDYHLRPFRERLAVYRLLQSFPANLIEVPIPFMREAADARVKLPETLPEGYVSNRNLIFYSIAAHFAEYNACDAIVGGHTGEDPEAFPDSASSFFRDFEELTNRALLIRKIRIELPFAKLDKTQVLQKALSWRVPLEFTWSCYWDREVPCGTCVSCRERADAFARLGVSDPLITKGNDPLPSHV
jgi:7-cyano-7-deazaguanine synthase